MHISQAKFTKAYPAAEHHTVEAFRLRGGDVTPRGALLVFNPGRDRDIENPSVLSTRMRAVTAS